MEAHLFKPLTIKEVTLKNRITVSPMCQYSSQDGFANDWHLVHLGSRAIGGASIVMTEATAVSAEGRISPSDLGIWKDDHIPYLKKITDFITKHESIPGIQLAHAGRKASHSVPWKGNRLVPLNEGGWKTVAPSSIAFSEETDLPESLTIGGIEKVIQDFKNAAARALAAGFKIVEIHAAHGYLINEFLSPLSNTRNDLYGGSFENRIRLLTKIIDAVKEVWPEGLPLFVRISSTDWAEGGWTIEDSVALAKILKAQGVDLIDCSSGGLLPIAKIPLSAGYQVPFATELKNETGILTGAVGLITTAHQAESIIAEGKANIVLLARQFLRDPYFPIHAAHELEVSLNWPVQYGRAK